MAKRKANVVPKIIVSGPNVTVDGVEVISFKGELQCDFHLSNVGTVKDLRQKAAVAHQQVIKQIVEADSGGTVVKKKKKATARARQPVPPVSEDQPD